MKVTKKIWDEYSDNLSVFIRRRVSDDAVDDILQDVFLKIHTKISSLNDSKKLASWIYQIARNTIIDYYRLKRPMDTVPEWIEQQSDEVEIIRHELSTCLAPMIDQLPPKYRSAIHQSEIEGKTQREIAEHEGISLSGAKSRVQRGRSILKGMLHECCEFELDRNNQVIDYNKKYADNDYC